MCCSSFTLGFLGGYWALGVDYETGSGIPEGLWTFVTASEASFTKDRSQYEDTYLKALITVSKYKRRYAKSLRIDVYTSNPEVQRELNRLGWTAAIANWTPSALLLPPGGGR